MKYNRPEVSIVIPHAGPIAPLRECIESIRNSTLIIDIDTSEVKSASLAYEIVVVADKPSVETEQYLNSLKEVVAIKNPELMGVEQALNTGFKKAKGKYICFLATDIRLFPGSLDIMRDALEDHPKFGWVALSSEHTGFLTGCSMWTREASEKVGLWDESYGNGYGFGDDDYLRRMWKAGYEPHIVHGVRVLHKQSKSGVQAIYGQEEKQKRYARNKALFKQRYGEDGTNWDNIPRYQPPPQFHRIDWIKSQVGLSDKILEIGCAENPVWKGTPFKVTTVDISSRPDEDCLPDIVADASNLPLEDKAYDVACANELLEHVTDPQAVLKEAVRVAKKKVILTVPAEHLWAPALKPFWNPGHLRFYTKESFEKELGTLGLPFNVELIRFKYWRHYGAVIHCNGGEPMVEEKVKINWGSFKDTFGSGWLNVDLLNIMTPPDHKFKQWDVRQKLTWLVDNSVDLHHASHLIEHLTLEEARLFLRELYRTLRPGGLVRIATPDLDIIVRHYYNRDMGFFNAVEQPPEYIQAPTMGEKFSRLLFSGDYQHRAIYTFEMLKNFLEQAGFTKIFRGVPGFSHSEVVQMEITDQHVKISLLVEAVK